MASTGIVLSRAMEEDLLATGGFCGRRSLGSILIYVAVGGGGVVPVRVLESDSIASVKLRIQSCKGFVVKKQKLVFEGRELARNDCLVRDYGVGDGNVVYLVLRLSDLRFITVKTDCGKEFEFHVEKNKNVGYVKQQIAKRGRGLLDFGAKALTSDGEELDDRRRIDEICRDNNDAVIHLLVKIPAKVRTRPVDKEFEICIDAPGEAEDDGNDDDDDDQAEAVFRRLSLEDAKVTDLVLLEAVRVNEKIELSNPSKDLVDAAVAGLRGNHSPMRSSEGSGGAYFMRDETGLSFVGVFKPVDEEPMAVNNPQGLPLSEDGEGLKRGTKVGEGALREVAAYILDHPVTGPRAYSGDELGFAGVPPTVMVKCSHEGFYYPTGFDGEVAKMGSLQMFVKNQGTCEDMGPRDFPVEEVHKISVLDMRLANADRHAGNILFSKGSDGRIELVPIDHGYCLPEKFEDCTFDWLNWPQARLPFSSTTLEYINSLEAEEDIALLKFHGWDVPLKCARTLSISTMLLKKGAARGLTPYAIGSMMCRESLNKDSVIEEIIMEAEETVLPEVGEAAFLEIVSEIMDRRLHGLKV